MGDPDDGHAQLFLEPPHQVHNLCLNGHVQRCGRLVGDEQLGITAQAHGDHHTLAHTAGELVGIVIQARFGPGNADHLEELHGPLARLALAHVEVQFQRLGDLAADGEHRIERGHGILEDHGDAVAANVPQLILTQLEQIAPVKPDFAVNNLAGRLGNQANE